MRRIDLVAATMQGWSRLDAGQREKFFEAFISAALRLDRVAMRDWLRKRLQRRPLAAPIDPARFAISDRDIAILLMRVAETPARDGADGG
jgi:hypothetical protein